jgi:hypothetical protein
MGDSNEEKNVSLGREIDSMISWQEDLERRGNDNRYDSSRIIVKCGSGIEKGRYVRPSFRVDGFVQGVPFAGGRGEYLRGLVVG